MKLLNNKKKIAGPSCRWGQGMQDMKNGRLEILKKRS